MDLIKKLFTDMGYTNVRTYIQSGNVIFDSPEHDCQCIGLSIEKVLRDQLGYEVPVFLYAPAQLQSIVKVCPFHSVPANVALHVSFLSVVPSNVYVESLMQFQTEQERFEVVGNVVYIMVLQGKYGKTKFSNTFLEKKLKVNATTRNWAIVKKMAAV
jgi:uncharacterized protein (DUF1697 family)